MSEKWYNLSIEQTEQKLNTSIDYGLSEKTARIRLRRDGENIIYPMPHASFFTYMKHAFSDITSYLLLATAVIAVIFKLNVSAIVIGAIILINNIFVLFTYVKARRILEDMGKHAIPTAKVIRDGRLYIIKQDRLVCGDIIIISAGDIVPCDARIIECDDLSVIETNLTSEIKAVEKHEKIIYGAAVPPSEQSNMLFASTVVTKGNGKAIVCATGEDTLACVLEKNTPIVCQDKLRVLNILKKYCSTWSLLMIAMILAITVADLFIGLNNRGLFDIFITGLSLAVAAMSEFYIIFGYIIIGCGLFGTLRKNGNVTTGAIIKNTECLETLKKITTLIVPKNGALFSREINLEMLYNGDSLYKASEKKLANSCGRLLRYAVVSTAKYGEYKYAENLSANDSYTAEEKAVISVAERTGLYSIELESDFPIIEHRAASIDNPYELTLVKGKGHNTLALRGDISRILEQCRFYCDGGQERPMTKKKLSQIEIDAKDAQREGCRVVAVASVTTDSEKLENIKIEECELVFEGFLVIREPLLQGAAKNISKCLDSNIKVILLSDETSEGVRNYARSLGIISGEDEIMTSSELSQMKDDLFRTNISLYNMYEGLTFAQKRLLLSHLKENGEIVGFLGDELEDLALIQEADVGFSSGITLSNDVAGIDLGGMGEYGFIQNIKEKSGGCEALKFVSDVIVSMPDKPTGGFNAIITSISSAKVIYQNLMRMIKYLITSQVARLFVVLYTVLAFNKSMAMTYEYIFKPVQLLFCGLIIDLAVVIIIAFQRSPIDILSQKENTEERLEKPLIHNFKPMVFGLFWAVLTVGVPFLMKTAGLVISDKQLGTMVFLSFIITQIITSSEIIIEKGLFAGKIHINRVYAAVLLLSCIFIAALILLPAFGSLFWVVRITLLQWVGVLAIPIIMLLTYELYKNIKK